MQNIPQRELLTVTIPTPLNERHLTDEDLRISEIRYRRLFEAARDGILLLDAVTLKITDVNPFMIDLLGYPYEEFLGKELWEMGFFGDRSASQEAFRDLQLTGYLRYDDLPLRAANGKIREVEFISNIYEENGSRVMQCNIRDITERKRLDVAQGLIEQRYHTLFESAPDGIIIASPESYYLDANASMCRMLGYTHDELIGLHASDVVTESEAAHLGEAFAEIKERSDYHREWQFKRKDDSVFAGDVMVTMMPDGNLLAMIRDITQRKRSDEALRASEARLRAMIDTEPECVKLLTADCSLIEMNPAGLSMIEADSFAEVQNHDVSKIVVEEHRKAFRNLTKAVFRGETGTLEFQIVGLKGNMRWLDTHASPLRDSGGKITALLGITRDITQSRQDEEVLKLFRALVDQSNDTIEVLDPETGRFLDVNEKGYLDLGYSREEFLALSVFDIDPLVDQSMFAKDVADLRRSGAAMWEGIHQRKDGSTFPVEVNLKYVRLDRDYIVAVVRDITERNHADKALRESETRYRTLFETSPDGVAMFDPQMNVLVANNRSADIFGYPNAAEMIGKNAFDLIAPENLNRARANIDGIFASGYLAPVESMGLKADGSRFAVEFSASLIRNAEEQPTAVLGVTRDISDRKQLEDQVRQSQKMEAVGLLAGGIAHDFNNLLTAISGYSNLTLTTMPDDDPLRQNIIEIKDAGDRAAALTGQLLAFSRKQVLKPRVHNLNTSITDIEKMLRRIIRENIEFRTVLDPTLGNIKADPGQIEQVIMNLVVNARDAMPNGGILTIETQNICLDENYLSQHIEVTPGEFVKMTVTDTGEGMDEATRQRIFEPFYTTKEVGKGTGLGLSTVYGIVKQSGGDVMVYSEPGHGTTFKIYLPCVNETVQKVKLVEDKNEKYTGTETVLLVEDEEFVRRLICEVLTRNGYNVLEAASGKAALSICDTYTEPIHILLTDVIMPEMGGSQLKDNVVKLHPDIKVLFMSGYTNDSIDNRGIFDSDSEFIEKPFTPNGLARKVREVLGS